MSALSRRALLTLPGALLLAGEPARADLSQATRLAAFDQVWTTVYTRHWDPTFGGVDWRAMKKKYEPLVRASRTDAQFYGLLQKLLGELKQSHFAVFPHERASGGNDDEGPTRRGTGETGAVVGMVEGRPTILRVDPDSPAARAGLRPGIEVVSVGGEALAKAAAGVSNRMPGARAGTLAVYTRLTLQGLLTGAVGERVELRVREGDGPEREVGIVCAAPRGEWARPLPLLPPQPVVFESRTLAGGIAYIHFSIFLNPVIEKLTAAVQSARRSGAPGLVLDLRGNPGGQIGLTWLVGSLLATKRGSLGTMKMRSTEMRFPAFPREDGSYGGPVVVLVDELSLSCSEVVAAGLQDTRRALVAGRRTGGMVLPSVVEKLPGGGALQYATADYKTPSGILIEGRGVLPDIPVALTRAALLADPDPDLTAALARLNSLSQEKKP